MWLDQFFGKRPTTALPLYLFNTLGKEKQVFVPTTQTKLVRMYCCGPTVYDRQHIGNLSKAVFDDVVRRVLEYNNYKVKQVINITDFGHLVSDADDGEDKMTKGLKREKLKFTMENMRDFATKYMDLYLEDIKALNVAVDKIKFPRASDYVPAMIAMVKTLEEKGYAYTTSDGVYFDTTRFQEYGALGGINTGNQTEGARIVANTEKHHPRDFALWKSNKRLGWDRR
jgi:cysteinyl-tRNA synthetase